MHICNTQAGCFPRRSCLLITSSALARLGSAQVCSKQQQLLFLLHYTILGGGGSGGGHISKEEAKAGSIYMAATVVTTTTSKSGRKNLISRTLQRCKSGLSTAAAGGSSSQSSSSPPGCFSVYVGPERERFVVRAECANHPLFRRLLDDAEREYGYAAQGPLALPGCDVDAFLDVLWQMERADADEEVAAASSPICGLHSGSKGRAAGYRMISSSPMVGRRK